MVKVGRAPASMEYLTLKGCLRERCPVTSFMASALISQRVKVSMGIGLVMAMMATRCTGSRSNSRQRTGTCLMSLSTLSRMNLAMVRSRLDHSSTYHGFLSTALCWASEDFMISFIGISRRSVPSGSWSMSPTRSRARRCGCWMFLRLGSASSSSDSSPSGGGRTGGRRSALSRKVRISDLISSTCSTLISVTSFSVR